LLNFGPSEHYRREQPFLEGLRDLGWIEGQNIAIERRYANENRNQLLDTVADLVRLRVDVIVALDGLEVHQLGRKFRVPIRLPHRISVLDSDVLSFYVAKLAQSQPNCLESGGLTSWVG
jgi:hypothetical protein